MVPQRMLFTGALCVCLAMVSAVEIPRPSPEDERILGGVGAASPTSHGDEAAYQQRARQFLETFAAGDLAPYRRGRWLSGGDPGTYTHPLAIAKLLTGNNDPLARTVIADDRAAGETYHFAAAGWARTIPLFTDRVPQSIRSTLTAVPGNWLRGQGTDNHEAMWRTSAITLSSLNGGEARGRDWLIDYVRKLYTYGQPEWDSPRYMPYVTMGLHNIYDFSGDEQARAWAKAGLDWFAVAYALRRAGGVYAGPTSRGSSGQPGGSPMDMVGWLWWGGEAGMNTGHMRPGVWAASSRYRPPGVIGRIARREIASLPVVVEQAITNYWNGLDSTALPPIPNQGHATLWISREATLGTAWYADDVCSQMVHLRAVGVRGERGAAIIGGWPGLKDGKRTLGEGHCAVFGRKNNPQRHPVVEARHGQFAQVDNVAVCIADFPSATADPWTYVTTQGRVQQQRGWYIFSLGNATVAVYPLGEATTTTVDGEALIRIAPVNGTRSGFVMAMWDRHAEEHSGGSAMQRLAVDTSRWQEGSVGIRTLNGRTAIITHDATATTPRVSIDGQAVSHQGHPVYASPIVHCAAGVLRISDGREGYAIDVTGAVPRYRAITSLDSDEAPVSAPPQRPEAPARPTRSATSGPSEAQLSQWREGVEADLRQLVSAGTVLTFTHSRMGEAQITAIDDAGRYQLSARGMSMAMPFPRLGASEQAEIASSVARHLQTPEAHARSLALLHEQGERSSHRYREHRLAAGEVGTEVLAAWE